MTDDQNRTKKTDTNQASEDNTQRTMPSITKLLNRKSLKKKASTSESTPPPPPPPPPPPKAPESSEEMAPRQSEVPVLVPSSFREEISIDFADSNEPHPPIILQSPEPPAPEIPEVELKIPPKIQPTTRRAHPKPSELKIWNRNLLQSGSDPLGKGLCHLIDQGATSALFLAIALSTANPSIPLFVSSAAITLKSDQKHKIELWTGLQWNPMVVPELWNYFVRTGNAELSPPGTLTNVTSARNVVRAAFGVNKSEWILLIRVGPQQACRGVVAIISERSLVEHLNLALPFFNAELPRAA